MEDPGATLDSPGCKSPFVSARLPFWPSDLQRERTST